MKYTIKSDKLTAVIDSFGAELCSVKDASGREYIWTSEDVWKRHAPLLFPFVCNTASKKYTVNGKEYALSNHGFTRDTDFPTAESTDSAVELSYNPMTAQRHIIPMILSFRQSIRFRAAC